MRFHRDTCNKTKKPKLPWCRWTLEVDSERWDAAQWAGALGSFVSTEKGEILHTMGYTSFCWTAGSHVTLGHETQRVGLFIDLGPPLT